MDFKDRVNPVWKEVGREVGAEFESHDYHDGDWGRLAYRASLVRRTGRWPIALGYRFDPTPDLNPDDIDRVNRRRSLTMMKAPANIPANFLVEIIRSWDQPRSIVVNRKLGLFTTLPIRLRDKRRQVIAVYENILNALLDSEQVRSLVPRALKFGSRLSLENSQLSFKEWEVIEDPSRLRALFMLFDALLERLEQPEVIRLIVESIREQEVPRSLKELYTALHELGIEAPSLGRDPVWRSPCPGKWIAEEDIPRWLEIAGGPIRWVGVPRQKSHPYQFYVLDSRLKPDFPIVAVHSKFKTVRSFPLIGRHTITGILWRLCHNHHDINEKFSSIIADGLNQDTPLGETIKSLDKDFHITSDPPRGCWVLSLSGGFFCDHAPRTLTRPIWDCFQVTANHIVALPIPSSK